MNYQNYPKKQFRSYDYERAMTFSLAWHHRTGCKSLLQKYDIDVSVRRLITSYMRITELVPTRKLFNRTVAFRNEDVPVECRRPINDENYYGTLDGVHFCVVHAYIRTTTKTDDKLHHKHLYFTKRHFYELSIYTSKYRAVGPMWIPLSRPATIKEMDFLNSSKVWDRVFSYNSV
jgi:hypothetical protein